MREFQLIPKLLLTLRDMSLSQPTIAAISNVLSFLLQGFPNSNDLLRWASSAGGGAGQTAVDGIRPTALCSWDSRMARSSMARSS